MVWWSGTKAEREGRKGLGNRYSNNSSGYQESSFEIGQQGYKRGEKRDAGVNKIIGRSRGEWGRESQKYIEQRGKYFGNAQVSGEHVSRAANEPNKILGGTKSK